jgi:hypothetical protein
MDPTTNPQQGIESPNKKNRLTEIVLIVAVILVCIILGLFYFDILPIPLKLPGQTNKPTPVPKPTAFQYDSAKAKTILTQYIQDALKSELLPENIEVKQGMSTNGDIVDIQYEFGSRFTALESTVSADFHYNENTNVPSDFWIFIQPKNINQTTATPFLANSLLSSYFTSPYAISDCQTKGITSYCENVQILTEGKKGYGIAFIKEGPRITSFIYNCFISKESKNYNKSNNCITPP